MHLFVLAIFLGCATAEQVYLSGNYYDRKSGNCPGGSILRDCSVCSLSECATQCNHYGTQCTGFSYNANSVNRKCLVKNIVCSNQNVASSAYTYYELVAALPPTRAPVLPTFTPSPAAPRTVSGDEYVPFGANCPSNTIDECASCSRQECYRQCNARTNAQPPCVGVSFLQGGNPSCLIKSKCDKSQLRPSSYEYAERAIRFTASERYYFAQDVILETYNTVMFKAKICSHLMIGLWKKGADGDLDKSRYEIMLAERQNQQEINYVKKYTRSGGNPYPEAYDYTRNLVSCDNYRQFWLQYGNGRLLLGQGETVNTNNAVIRWQDLQPFTVSRIGFKTCCGVQQGNAMITKLAIESGGSQPVIPVRTTRRTTRRTTTRQQAFNPCFSFPCRNGGSCVQYGTEYSCQCTTDYYGSRCENNFCTPNPCANGGFCTITSAQQGYFKCICAGGWSGDRCRKAPPARVTLQPSMNNYLFQPEGYCLGYTYNQIFYDNKQRCASKCTNDAWKCTSFVWDKTQKKCLLKNVTRGQCIAPFPDSNREFYWKIVGQVTARRTTTMTTLFQRDPLSYYERNFGLCSDRANLQSSEFDEVARRTTLTQVACAKICNNIERCGSFLYDTDTSVCQLKKYNCRQFQTASRTVITYVKKGWSCPEPRQSDQYGDNIDNDCDGQIDEEECDTVDNDNDGRIDEDCRARKTIEDISDTEHCVSPEFLKNEGTQFYLMFVGYPNAVKQVPMSAYVTTSYAEKAVAFTYRPSDDKSNRTIERGQYTNVGLPYYLRLNNNNQMKDFCSLVKVDLTKEYRRLPHISVVGTSNFGDGSDGYLALPVKSLGRRYVLSTKTSAGYKTFLAVMAVTDKTDIEIKVPQGSKARFCFANSCYSKSSKALKLTMNRCNMIHATSDGDISGIVVRGTKNIAVFNGMTKHITPDNQLVEQLTPTSQWGTQFIIPSMPDRKLTRTTDEIKVTNIEPNTKVVVGVDQRETHTLNDIGETKTISLTPGQLKYIVSDKPVQIVQFARYRQTLKDIIDLAMLIVPPVEQWQRSYTFTAIGGDNSSHLMLAFRKTQLNRLLLNGQVVMISRFDKLYYLPNSEYVAGFIQIRKGAHTIEVETGFGNFGASVIGIGANGKTLYGYPAGLNQKRINSPCMKCPATNCDGLDNDCDGDIDEEYKNKRDDDDDGRVDEDYCSENPGQDNVNEIEARLRHTYASLKTDQPAGVSSGRNSAKMCLYSVKVLLFVLQLQRYLCFT